jgi:exodeoxyribonuclease VII small subunit
MPEMKYSKAMQRLEEIIHKIENEEIDIDELSESVKEAVGLVGLCKKKIEKAELEVKEAVKAFDSTTEK